MGWIVALVVWTVGFATVCTPENGCPAEPKPKKYEITIIQNER